jgi:L-threonylcarbamoyladenylate synthase
MFPIDSKDLMRARDLLWNGDVVGMPTETVYGLAASIESEAGIRKIFSLKERPFFDPLIVHVSSLKEAQSLTSHWSPLADFIARVFWPGPLTLILPKADHVNPLITSGLPSVGIRYPAHPLTIELIRATGHPLAAPSANKFGRTSPSQASHVRAEFAGTDLFVLDGGVCDVGIESTVLRVVQDANEQRLEILRPGAITASLLQNALSKWEGKVEVSSLTSEASPGHLQHHYMPNIPLLILRNNSASIEQLGRLNLTKKSRGRELQLSDDAVQAARELYSEMREASAKGVDYLFVKKTPERLNEDWIAIWDRLTRAASLDLSGSVHE